MRNITKGEAIKFLTECSEGTCATIFDFVQMRKPMNYARFDEILSDSHDKLMEFIYQGKEVEYRVPANITANRIVFRVFNNGTDDDDLSTLDLSGKDRHCLITDNWRTVVIVVENYDDPEFPIIKYLIYHRVPEEWISSCRLQVGLK